MPAKKNILFTISLLLSILIILVSCTAMLTPGFYSAETSNWQVQSTGQDMIDLFFVVPCLLTAAILYYLGKPWAALIWAGIILYLAYTFVIYCFSVHFNRLFVPYCLCFGLSFYGLLYFLFTQSSTHHIFHLPGKKITRYTSTYFFIIAAAFYFLWLAEIIPANIQNKIPQSLTDTGLFTNSVQVLDLAVLLPGVFITAILMLRQHTLGYILAPMLLTFFILMDITIAVLSMLMKSKAAGGNNSIAIVMMMLALTSLVFLAFFIKHKAEQ